MTKWKIFAVLIFAMIAVLYLIDRYVHVYITG
jgi:hypothetical protein